MTSGSAQQLQSYHDPGQAIAPSLKMIKDEFFCRSVCSFSAPDGFSLYSVSCHMIYK